MRDPDGDFETLFALVPYQIVWRNGRGWIVTVWRCVFPRTTKH